MYNFKKMFLKSKTKNLFSKATYTALKSISNDLLDVMTELNFNNDYNFNNNTTQNDIDKTLKSDEIFDKIYDCYLQNKRLLKNLKRINKLFKKDSKDIDLQNLVFTALDSEVYDYEYLLDLIKAQAQRMLTHFESDDSYNIDSKYIARDLKLLIKIIDILEDNNNSLYEFSTNTNESNEIDNSNFSYNCLVHVNTQNANRFTNNIEFVEKFPHELYVLKARSIFKKLMGINLFTWFD